MSTPARRASWLRYARRVRAEEKAARTPEEWAAMAARRREAARIGREAYLALLEDPAYYSAQLRATRKRGLENARRGAEQRRAARRAEGFRRVPEIEAQLDAIAAGVLEKFGL